MKKGRKRTAVICLLVLAGSFGLFRNAEGVYAKEKFGILKEAQEVGQEGVLSYIPNEWIEENFMQDILIEKNHLLSFYSVYDSENNTDVLHLRLFHLDTGEMLSETELYMENAYLAVVQFSSEQIVVSDSQSGKIHVFDENLKEVGQYEAFGDSIYVDPSITKAYCFDSEEGLWELTLENGEKQQLLGNIKNLSAYYCLGNDISMQYVDTASVAKKECYAGLNLETGKLEMLEIDDCFFGVEYYEGIWAGELLTEDGSYLLGTQQKPYKAQIDSGYPVMRLSGSAPQLLFMMSYEDGIQSMMAYGMDGAYLSGFSMEDIGGTLTMRQAWSEEAEGYFLIVIDDTGHDRLYFWDMTKETEGEALELKAYTQKEELIGTILEQQYYDRAKELSEKYDMTIKIAEQCDKEYSNKYAEQEYDTDKIAAGLDVLEKALANYPDGFLQQLRYGGFRKLEINLMGTISNKEQIEGFVSSAFVQQENGKITIVFNIGESAECLEGNVYHEFSHVIDKVLENDASYRDDALYAEETWWTLNPTEFIALNPEYGGYYESYEEMPMDYYQEDFTAYFAIDYGKTFSTEDRATIFEEAMSGMYPVFSSAPLRAKLEYYCQCIRDCFDTTGWPEHTAWEQILY